MEDYNFPVKISGNLWWVGNRLDDEILQCHTYLIEAGDKSVLIDPGSKLTFPGTLKKIEKILPFDSLKYFIVHHQDPDIAGALEKVDSLVKREDAVILSHWRAIALLKHLDLKLPFRCVEKMGWELKDGDLDLSFIFTPYLHFPGAFCTLEKKSRSLFTSDIFGAFTDEFCLYARDESYLEQMKPFHEHYMPSREILTYAMENFSRLELDRILPQHGSIIRKELIPFMIENLKSIDCGLFLMAKSDTDVMKLSRLNKFLNNFLETLISYRNFDTIINELLEHIKTIIPAASMSFLIEQEGGEWKLLEESTRYKRVLLPPESWLVQMCMSICGKNDDTSGIKFGDMHRIAIPLQTGDGDITIGHAIIDLNEDLELDKETESILLQLSHPLGIAVERELLEQRLDQEKQRFYELSIRDSLTGFYNRTYMNETLPRIFSHHDRDIIIDIAVLVFDLDHFKSVNDTYGHPIGDEVLKRSTKCITRNLRNGDIAVRTGGEEFAVFMIMQNRMDAEKTAERIRLDVRMIDYSDIMPGKVQTISAGLVHRDKGESIDRLLSRGDQCLYRAKNSGRDRVVKG